MATGSSWRDSQCNRQRVGHVEILVREDMLEAWFVGGGHDTGRSVPISGSRNQL